MGTRIEALSLVSGGLRRRRSALRLAVAAARDSLREAHIRPADVDLLVNVGIYRDRLLGEPALAPLIQEDAGLDLGDPEAGQTGTFSFDIANGACGVLSALQVADGFLEAGTARTALIVASDADPGQRLAPDFPIPPAGGALVCRWADDGTGLAGFRWHHDHDGGSTFRSTVTFEDGHNRLAVSEDPLFAERAGDAAGRAAFDLLAGHGLSADDVDLVVADPDRPYFLKILADHLGRPETEILTAGAPLHTVGLLAALHRAESEGRLRRGAICLLVGGAAGITGGAALYRA